MSIVIPVLMEYNNRGQKAAEIGLKKIAAGAGIAALSWQTLGKFAADANKAFIEDTKSQQLMALAIRDNTNATTEQIAAQESFIQYTQSTTKILDDQLRPAYATLVRWTRSTTKAQELLNGAMDIAAGTGKDLESVAVALGKAYGGNWTALKRLGVPIDENTVKSKDFTAAWYQLLNAFEGSQAASTKAQGALGDLRVEWENLKEQTGGFLSWAAKPFVQFTAATLEMLNYMADGVKELTASEEKLIATTERLTSAAKARAFEERMNAKWTSMQAEAHKKAAAAAAKAAEKARELAKANKERLADALKTAQERLAKITDEMNSYRDSVAGVVTGYASLDDAVSTAQASEDAYNEALRERAAAYEELKKIQATQGSLVPGTQQVTDMEALAAATQKVADANKAVTDAQAKRVDYSSQFSAQITAAKSFAGNLQKLVSEKGLLGPGLQQLLALGPVAGAQVAADLLAGTKDLTVSSLNKQLGELAAAGQGLGAASGTQIYGADLLAAQGVVAGVKQAQTINVTVTSADPQAVVDALRKYMNAKGSVPIRVSG